MTKKIYAIMVKKMVKVKNPAGFFENPTVFFKPRAGFFPPHFQMGEKPCRVFSKK